MRASTGTWTRGFTGPASRSTVKHHALPLAHTGDVSGRFPPPSSLTRQLSAKFLQTSSVTCSVCRSASGCPGCHLRYSQVTLTPLLLVPSAPSSCGHSTPSMSSSMIPDLDAPAPPPDPAINLRVRPSWYRSSVLSPSRTVLVRSRDSPGSSPGRAWTLG